VTALGVSVLLTVLQDAIAGDTFHHPMSQPPSEFRGLFQG
jgi:hypothetical protein